MPPRIGIRTTDQGNLPRQIFQARCMARDMTASGIVGGRLLALRRIITCITSLISVLHKSGRARIRGSMFLMEEKVAVVPGTAFGDCGEGFLRISYAYSLEKLKIAMERIALFIETLR